MIMYPRFVKNKNNDCQLLSISSSLLYYYYCKLIPRNKSIYMTQYTIHFQFKSTKFETQTMFNGCNCESVSKFMGNLTCSFENIFQISLGFKIQISYKKKISNQIKPRMQNSYTKPTSSTKLKPRIIQQYMIFRHLNFFPHSFNVHLFFSLTLSFYYITLAYLYPSQDKMYTQQFPKPSNDKKKLKITTSGLNKPMQYPS